MDRETLRKLQLVQLEIAKEVKRVCEENDIEYFLDSGTLLGAVRHKGFIPWDDDLDMGMFREDYEKFITIAPVKLNEKYELIEWKTEKDYPHPFCKVMKKDTQYIEEVHAGNSKNGIFVDIFPYDNFPCEEVLKKAQNRRLTMWRSLIRAKCHYRTWFARNKFNIKRWIKNLPMRLLSIFYNKEKLIEKYEISVKKNNTVSSDIIFTHGCSAYGNWTIPKKNLLEKVELSFEGEMFMCPAGYDGYLRSVYGDYMQLPPESERENRHAIIKIDFGGEK